MQKPPPDYSLEFVLHPERDAAYVHFENSASHPFQPSPADFPRVNVWWLAEAALLTYWEEKDASVIFQKAGLSSEYLRVGLTDCYVAWQDDFVLVAFRGTEPSEWGDVLTDVNVQLVHWTTGRVHRGFRDAIDLIWPVLEEKLRQLSPGRTVWFCGHSLGAALATLAADRFPGARGVCTFGSPRIGTSAFADAFGAKLKERTLRYVNDHDVVTHVPPPLFGYTHVDERRFISPEGQVSAGAPAVAHFFADLIGRPAQLLDIIDGLQVKGEAPVFLLDHMPKAYAIFTWNDLDANG